METADADFVRRWDDDDYQSRIRQDAQECVSYSDHTLGLAMGLKGRVTRGSAFDTLYPKGGKPCLADIKQNADLQDCWFLSTVAAVLASKGAEFIQEMIENPDADGNVVVHFKDRDYKVPCAELKDKDGNVSVSKSAPWVKVLEMAMQMHRMHEIFESRNGKIDMSENNAKDALDAIFGAKTDEGSYSDRSVEFGKLHIGVKQSSLEALETLNRWIENDHRPVVLGHDGGIFDFVAPGHAVTLLKVDLKNESVTIMDPYGRILVKDAGFLDNCTILSSLP